MSNLGYHNISVPTHPYRGDNELVLSINPGEGVVLRGRNGSGKTTILKMLAGHYEGRVLFNDSRWEGHYIAERPFLLSGLTVTKQLAYYRSLYQNESEPWGWLQDLSYMQVSALSRGQLQRLSLTRLAYSSATLWLLDEPFNSLDKEGQVAFSGYIDKHLVNGGSVLYASHIALRAGDRVICID